MLDARCDPVVLRSNCPAIQPTRRCSRHDTCYSLLCILLSLSLLFAGCSRKFTRANFDSIYVGQEQWEVADVMGNPESQGRFASEWHYVKDSSKHYFKAVIAFDEDRRVASKRWVEPGHDGPERVDGSGFRDHKDN